MEPVIPGELVGYEEEFLPRFGTYSENGNVYASNIGKLEKDLEKREVRVKAFTRIPLFYKRGAIVYGKVSQVSDNFAIIDLWPRREGQFYYIPRPVTHVIPISEVKRGFVKSMKEEFQIGDIIRAKIIEISPFSVTLTTRANNLGIIQAFCSECRHPLTLKKGILICQNCGNKEKRKISLDYGKVEIFSKEGI